jgi:hypothetical protein
MYRFAPGIFLSASRDLAGAPLRLLLEEGQRRALAMGVAYASTTSGSPISTGRAAVQGLLSTAPPSADWELYGPNGVLGDIHRRFNDWSDRCSLASPGGAAAGQAFLEVFCRRLDEVKEAVPALYRVLGDLGSARAVAQELTAMAAECFKPPRGPPACIQDALAINAVCAALLHPMEAQNLIDPVSRAAWIRTMHRDVQSRGGGAGADGAGESGADPGAVQRLRAELGLPATRKFMDELRVLLAARPLNSVSIAKKLTSSPLAFVRRTGLGITPPIAYISTLYRTELEEVGLHVLKDKWVYNLSVRLAAGKSGKLLQTAESWRVSKPQATAIAEFRFDEVDLFDLAYEIKGTQGFTEYVLPSPELRFSEIEHYVAYDVLIKRIEDAHSLDPLATNSLSSAVERAHAYFDACCNAEMTREGAITNVQSFFRELWVAVREEWFPLMTSKLPLQTFPDVVVPRTASCWGLLDAAEVQERQVRALLASSVSKFLGLSQTRTSYAAGATRPSSGGAGSSRAARSRSPSPSRSPRAADGRVPRSASPVPAAPAAPAAAVESLHQLLVEYVNATDFRFSPGGTVVVPKQAARALGVPVGRQGAFAASATTAAAFAASAITATAVANTATTATTAPGPLDDGAGERSLARALALRGCGSDDGGRLGSSLRQRVTELHAIAKAGGLGPSRRHARGQLIEEGARQGLSLRAGRMIAVGSALVPTGIKMLLLHGRARTEQLVKVVARQGRLLVRMPGEAPWVVRRLAVACTLRRLAPERGDDRPVEARLGKGGRGTSALAFAAVAAGADADIAGPQPVPAQGDAPDSTNRSSESRIVDTLENSADISCLNNVRNSPTVTVVEVGARLGLGNVAAALRGVVVPIIMSPLTLSSKVVLFMLAISATTAPAILVPIGGGVWGRRAPSSWLGATAMKGTSALASRWAPLLLSSPLTGLTAHYVAAQHLTPRDATCTNWLAVCLVTPGHAGVPGTVWRNLSELEGRPEHVMAAVAAYRGHSLFHSVPMASSRLPVFSASALATVDAALGPEGSFEVGKRAALPPLAGPSQGYERESRTFDEMWALHCTEVKELTAVFASPGPPLSPAETLALLGPLTAGFGQVSSGADTGGEAAATARAFDAIWAEDCQALRARITVGDAAMIPSSLKEPGALASYADAALALAPFSSRCRPPRTVRRAPPLPQAQGPPGPTDFEAFYPPGHFRSKADPWLISQRAYLLDALEHGAAATVTPPEVLVFSDHERLPQYRGRLYELDTAAGRYVLTDTAAPATTHLNRPFAVQFAADYPDQELFSTLDFGVNFEAENMEMQVVFPRHLLSLAGGLAKVQVDIAERAGHGWYEINSVIPRNPWRPQQIGSRLKPNGKYRVIVNASFPHGDLADGHGIQVQSLNLLSKRSYDAVLGTDGARMCRLQRRLRTTAGSPPPPSACTLHGDEPCSCGRSDGALKPAMQPDVQAKRPGRVTVALIQAALSHPWSLHGGHDTILCSPFGGADRDAVYEAYAQYTTANRAGTAFSVAAQHGVRCFPLQAHSDPRARASYETVLAAQVARGRSLQLTDRPTQGRSHLHLVAERIIAKASLLYSSHKATCLAVSNTGRRVLHLGAVPHSNGLFAEACRLLGHACSDVIASGLLNDSLYQDLMAEASAGVYGFVVATVACDSHQVRARPLRDRALGGAPMPYLTAAESLLVGNSDRTTRRMVAIILAAWRRGAAYLVMSPADLGGDEPALDPLFFPRAATHSPLWVQRVVLDLESQTGGRQAHFDMCCLVPTSAG